MQKSNLQTSHCASSLFKALLFTLYSSLFTISIASAQWFPIGPGGGGSMYSPQISPVDTNCLTVSCDMGGYYVTSDGGRNWNMIDLNALAYISAFDSQEAGTIYAGSNSLYKSEDYGKTWKDILGDAGGRKIPSFVKVDPENNSIVYLSLGSRRTGLDQFMISKDKGVTWEKAGSVLPFGSQIRGIYIDKNSPVEKRIIYIPTNSGLYRSVNGGESFSSIDSGLPGNNILLFGLGCDTANKRTVLYAGITNEGLYKSSDAGKTWLKLSGVPVPDPEGYKLVVGYINPEVVYYGTYENYNGFVYKSEDGGKTWRSVLTPGNTDKKWASTEIGWTNSFAMNNLTGCETDENIVVFTDFMRVTRTLDGGKTWEEIYSFNKTGKYACSGGLEVTTCYGVHFDPKNEDRMYITYTDIGLFKSVDRGYSWKYIGNRWNTFYWLDIDPDNPERIYAAVSDVHDLPESKMLQDIGKGSGGILISDDAGETWKRSRKGLPNGVGTCVVIDKKSPKDKRTVYATLCGKGVYKSIDSGNTWTEINNGIGPCMSAWRLVMSGNVLYLGVTRGPGGKTGALYKSVNGGQSWEKAVQSFPWLTDVYVKQNNPNEVYVSCYRSGTADGGLYKSVDAGKTFEKILKQNYIYGVTVDEKNPLTIYAAYTNDDNEDEEKGYFVSRDGGKKWENVLTPFRNTHRVVINPRDSGQLYVTTFGGGVLTNKEPIKDIQILETENENNKESIKKTFECPKVYGNYKIDGKLNENIWEKAGKIMDFMLVSGDDPAEKTTVYLSHDDEKLYIAYDCEESLMKKISKKYDWEQHDADLWEDDGVEMFFDANLQQRYYYHFIVNTNACIYDAKHNRDRGNEIIDDISWNPVVTASCELNSKGYVVEMAIPLSDLGIKTPVEPGTVVYFNLNRNRYAVENELFTWTELSPDTNYHEPDRFGKMILK
ncbi:MAG: hypothetical protein A2252_12385 [Elusimicrobia bacterium RIFOXYA2_FULL_39_19]|nr:MAG: hypothetical protein A2252_12385 [Elusimicrobia bacterium RIFOXYA2_FULL_39_19]